MWRPCRSPGTQIWKGSNNIDANKMLSVQEQHKCHLAGWVLDALAACGAYREKICTVSAHTGSRGEAKVNADLHDGRKSLKFWLGGCKWLSGRWSLCQGRKMAAREHQRCFSPSALLAGGDLPPRTGIPRALWSIIPAPLFTRDVEKD